MHVVHVHRGVVYRHLLASLWTTMASAASRSAVAPNLMWRNGTNSSRGLPVCSQKENLPALDWWHATQYSEGWRRSGATGSGDTDLAANNTSGLTSHRHWCDDSLICQVTPKTLEKKVTGRASRPGLRPPSAATSHHPRNCNVRCYHAKRHLRSGDPLPDQTVYTWKATSSCGPAN